jgi:hypothetical protein
VIASVIIQRVKATEEAELLENMLHIIRLTILLSVCACLIFLSFHLFLYLSIGLHSHAPQFLALDFDLSESHLYHSYIVLSHLCLPRIQQEGLSWL